MENISQASAKNVQNFRKKQPSVASLVQGILSGNTSCLSRAITLIESTNPEHAHKANEIITSCLENTKPTIRIGITGIPGVGKSTFIESFGNYLTRLGKKVAVLAIDPSSSLSGGSILGDKTRMEELVKNPNAYVRPSATGNTLGGVARKTRDTIVLCEACGFDILIIETVGVGQNEIAVDRMVDFFLLLQIAGAGDALQGIKRGIMEMAEAILITKADGDGLAAAQLAKTTYCKALGLFPARKSGWIPITATCSALTQDGIPELWQTICAYHIHTKQNGYFETKRTEQKEYWLLETIDEQLKSNFYNHPKIQSLLAATKKAVQKEEISPFAAAQMLLNKYLE
nr:methylmalonyl Co-A mutase-associated GTPase MeaB [Flavobacterium crassostreae]